MAKYRRIYLLALIIGILCSGCATWELISNGNANWRRGIFEVYLPKGWVKYNPSGDILFLTKDGTFLQRITISGRELSKEFTLTKKKITEDMLIQDVASVVIDELSLNQDLHNLEILDNKPGKIGGVDCFRLAYAYNNKDFLKYAGILYGFILKKKYYEVQFLAAKQHYFQKDFPDFEKFVSNVKIVQE